MVNERHRQAGKIGFGYIEWTFLYTQHTHSHIHTYTEQLTIQTDTHTLSSKFTFSLFIFSLITNTDLILAYLQMGFSHHTKQQNEISFKLHQNYYNC